MSFPLVNLDPQLFLSGLEGGLVLYEQPIHYKDGSVAYEVLLRQKGRGDEIYSALPLIMSMEEDRTIPLLDRAVIRAVFKAGSKGKIRHVNISPVTLNYNGKLVEDIRGQMSHWNVDSNMIRFEITEKTSIQSAGYSTAAKIAQLGFDLVFDDWGMGHTLWGMITLKPRSIKIDAKFIQGMMKSPMYKKLVSTMIEQGHAIGSRVIAEGVETLEIYNECVNMGFDGYQGFYLGRPVVLTYEYSI